MLISDSIGEYLAAKHNSVTHDTYVWYMRFLGYFEAWCKENNYLDLSQITHVQVQQFVSAQATDSARTRHHRAQVVKGFLNWCSLDSELGVKERTVKRIEMPKTTQSDVRIFEPWEFEALVAACDTMRHPHRNRAILHVLMETGVRASELCCDGERPEEETGLRMVNVMLNKPGQESILRVMGKGRKYRPLPIGNETRLALARYINRERGRGDSPYVFLAQGGNEPLSVKRLGEILDVLGEHAGVEDVHPHRFRHTFAINQLLSGTSSFVLMELLGHSTLEATKLYTRALTQIQAMRSATSVVDGMKKKRGKGRRA